MGNKDKKEKKEGKKAIQKETNEASFTVEEIEEDSAQKDKKKVKKMKQIQKSVESEVEIQNNESVNDEMQNLNDERNMNNKSDTASEKGPIKSSLTIFSDKKFDDLPISDTYETTYIILLQLHCHLHSYYY